MSPGPGTGRPGGPAGPGGPGGPGRPGFVPTGPAGVVPGKSLATAGNTGTKRVIPNKVRTENQIKMLFV